MADGPAQAGVATPSGPATSRAFEVIRYGGAGAVRASRLAPEEAPVALVHDAATTAVMLATPADLEDFAVGFSLTEGLVEHASQIDALEVVETELGFEARVWLAAASGAVHAARRRRLAGPTGCGLCGIDSLEAALRPARRVGDGLRVSADQVYAAVEALAAAQSLGAATRAVHAAGRWRPDSGLVAVREDVGRHNALDKLAGALARSGEPAGDGILVLTSRVSVEMVQKAAAIGAQVVVAVSAPTALAVRTAEACGLTLVAVARADGFEVFTHSERIS
ncbi:formate dehydrogenase accessory sulfurtransferase FdhD [Phenylobacterium sp. LjRoot225]|uniref:formate dehydrogenase accessory sulfurtransferase FdhD n=1 Tax=Phenylobacterium sp. LjRoot225 TaxID=3342285 RepID=UPI003ECC810F